MKVGLALINHNRPGGLPNEGTQSVEIRCWVAAFPGLAGAVSGGLAGAESTVADSQIRWNRSNEMKQHQDGCQKAGKKGHWLLRERPLQFSIQSQSPRRVPTGSAITTSWLITNWRTSGSMFVLIGAQAALVGLSFAIMVSTLGRR